MYIFIHNLGICPAIHSLQNLGSRSQLPMARHLCILEEIPLTVNLVVGCHPEILTNRNIPNMTPIYFVNPGETNIFPWAKNHVW